MKFLFGFSSADRKKDRITLLAGLRACPSQRARLLQRLHDLAGPTRKEKGCISFDVHRSQVDPDLFTIYQAREGEEFLEAHAKTLHVQSFRAEAPQLLEGPVLTTRRKVVE
jgi:quinol monooxygenase YgiN